MKLIPTKNKKMFELGRAMDFLIEKLNEINIESIKGERGPILAQRLARHLRRCLYIFHSLNPLQLVSFIAMGYYDQSELHCVAFSSFSSRRQAQGYYQRMAKLLAIFTDLELYGSIRGKEFDVEVADRIHYVYRQLLQVLLYIYCFIAIISLHMGCKDV